MHILSYQDSLISALPFKQPAAFPSHPRGAYAALLYKVDNQARLPGGCKGGQGAAGRPNLSFTIGERERVAVEKLRLTLHRITDMNLLHEVEAALAIAAGKAAPDKKRDKAQKPKFAF